VRASDSSMGGEAGQFHTTRWTLVMASLHDQSQTGRVDLADICQTYWYPLYAFARRWGLVGIAEAEPFSSYDNAATALGIGVGTVKTLIHRLRKQYLAVVRQEVARTVSNPAEIGAEIRALCEALIAAEGRLKP
jgi:hypothetical protein